MKSDPMFNILYRDDSLTLNFNEAISDIDYLDQAVREDGTLDLELNVYHLFYPWTRQAEFHCSLSIAIMKTDR